MMVAESLAVAPIPELAGSVQPALLVEHWRAWGSPQVDSLGTGSLEVDSQEQLGCGSRLDDPRQAYAQAPSVVRY